MNFFRTAGALFLLRREGPHRFTQKRPQTAVSVLQSVAAAETPKNRHSRDFGVARFSTFATVSSHNGLWPGMPSCLLSADTVAKAFFD
jgi:hypothetical protein